MKDQNKCFFANFTGSEASLGLHCRLLILSFALVLCNYIVFQYNPAAHLGGHSLGSQETTQDDVYHGSTWQLFANISATSI